MTPGGPPPELVSAAAHVFVTDLATIELSPTDEHHLFRVLRLRDGETVTVSDGAGRYVRALVRGAALEVDSEVSVVARPHAIEVAFAVPKGDRPEWIVQKLTEIGADRIVPLRSDRSVVRWDADRARRQCERFERIAREAAMQSRRCHLPVVAPVTSLDDLGPGWSLGVPGGLPIATGVARLAVGPEGGWTPRELELVSDHRGLGGTVLRAETAALVACTLMVAARPATVG